MNTQATTATVTPFTQNLKQQQQKQQTPKEVIAANVQALIQQLEQGHSEGLTAYLLAMGKFHNYSFGNIMEIARQKPDATRVAGMYAWNQLGRRVKKGEKGIRILAPMIGIRRKKDAEAEKDIHTQNQPVLVGFRSAYVFDVSQTDGAELPELSERVKGNVGEYRAANDARRMTKVVKEKLDKTKQFSEVVEVRLVSDAAGKGQANELPARKAYLKAVLDLLAGQEVDAKLKGEILKVAGIEKAEPEDLVLLTISSHGYTDERGIFHFVLQDVDQPQQVTDVLGRETLNTNELSAWLRDVDGGEMVMVVDACESEATIQAEGFKPGPMGSRGLGQLAYDKGMRVLAASKAKESAVERGGNIKDGLLS
jgi:N-terminal domain of anti-restriction factor ArdC